MNILLLTSVYPSPTDKNGNVTKVVQYFAAEWVKMGHQVIVIHNTARYPALIHMIPNGIKQKLTAKLNFYIPSLSDVKNSFREEFGIKVYKLPIFKIKPHGGHPTIVIKHQAKKIISILDKEKFHPDIIMGHWMSPQIQLIKILRAKFKCRTSLVLHGRGYIDDGKFNCLPYLKSVDALGCRSIFEAEFIKSHLKIEKSPFICYSGVPDEYLANCGFNKEKFMTIPQTWRFIYVGRLVAYKQIDKVLIALSQLNDQNYTFDIIGSGNEEAALIKQAEELRISNKVIFHGQLSREEVLECMKKAHSFVMISKGEVFGLVYLEAMANSCIAVGGLGQGIDGVIIDKKNGFLSPPADADALTRKLNEIMNLSVEQLQEISLNGYNTAQGYSDSNVAKRYLDDAWGNSNC